MTNLTVRLYQPLRNGSHRALTLAECKRIRAAHRINVFPSVSGAWRIERSDDGWYSLRAFTRTGESASWAIEVEETS